MRKILIVSMPFRIGVGGFLRSYYVLPRIAKLLADNDFEVNLYIPANALRTYALHHLPPEIERRTLAYTNAEGLVDEVFERAVAEIAILEKASKYSFTINEKFLRANIEYNRRFLLEELVHRTLSKQYSTVSSALRPLLIHVYERRFAEETKWFFQGHRYGYSMHETPDAVTALALLSSRNVKTAVLLQLDLGKRLVEKAVNLWLLKELSRKTSLEGVLSVSPAPIVETPEVLSLSKKVKILVPGVALGEDILRIVREKEPNTVIYYGRLSPEKGIFDLLKAWRIVEAKTTGAKLYIAGRFEDRRTESTFWKYIKKYNLKRINYLGYLSQEKLIEVVSKCSVLAYPSYRDSFSMVVLESLAMGLRIVAYDIPAIRYVYRGSRNLEIVPTGNIQLLSQKIIENLEKNFEIDDATTRILSLYSSWERVALKEYNCLRKTMLI